jgi:hypothetical protein
LPSIALSDLLPLDYLNDDETPSLLFNAREATKANIAVFNSKYSDKIERILKLPKNERAQALSAIRETNLNEVNVAPIDSCISKEEFEKMGGASKNESSMQWEPSVSDSNKVLSESIYVPQSLSASKNMMDIFSNVESQPKRPSYTIKNALINV